MRRNENTFPHLVVTLDDVQSPTPMMQATARLKADGIPHEVKTQYHLKIGSLNYYPAKGSLHRDGEHESRKRVDLDTLLVIIREEGL